MQADMKYFKIHILYVN